MKALLKISLFLTLSFNFASYGQKFQDQPSNENLQVQISQLHSLINELNVNQQYLFTKISPTGCSTTHMPINTQADSIDAIKNLSNNIYGEPAIMSGVSTKEPKNSVRNILKSDMKKIDHAKEEKILAKKAEILKKDLEDKLKADENIAKKATEAADKLNRFKKMKEDEKAPPAEVMITTTGAQATKDRIKKHGIEI